MPTRRTFIRNLSASTAGLTISMYAGSSLAFSNTVVQDPLGDVCKSLISIWGKKLLELQVKDSNSPNYGTIILPAENAIHGRSGDSVHPFLHLASTTGNHAYLDAAILLYRWMERTVSQADGSWLNEPKAGSWKGTTVFTTIALAESLLHYGHLLDNSFKQEVRDRLFKSGDYISQNFTIDYGNINYPIAATYALTLLDELLDAPAYRKKAKALADVAIKYFTKKDHLLSGEGGPLDTPSPKGCFSVDLGYNVEESLPSLVQYALLNKDNELLELLTTSLKAHLQFMLPDGGWDNSWGTRNYKWTYWGSRTSDGCQPAFALMADRDPAFYKAALQNTSLLQQHTHDGILYGGPHYHSHGITPCLHHTFCHIKALVTTIEKGYKTPAAKPEKIQLPREIPNSSTFIEDLQTMLVATDKIRATVTTYDRNYKKFKSGHTSGGALSMLWHQQLGVILCASMNEYQMLEADNMQVDNDPNSMPLTPRLQLIHNGHTYMNIQDLSATQYNDKKGNDTVVYTRSSLVNGDQQSPDTGKIQADISYHFQGNAVQIKYSCDAQQLPVQFILPLISSSEESWNRINANTYEVNKSGGKVVVSSKHAIDILPVTSKRIFNFVPGLEAIPFAVAAPVAEITISFHPAKKV